MARISTAAFRRFDIVVDVDYQASEALEETAARVRALAANPALLERVLKQAAAETLLVAYRWRFLYAIANATNMQRDGHHARAIAPVEQSLRHRFNSLASKLDALELKGLHAAANKTRAELAGLGADIQAGIAVKSQARRGALPKASPGFRQLAFRVMELLADAKGMVATTSDAGVSLGIGNREALDAIKTPSATPLLTDHPTYSPNNILWRQLEFGTGAFSSRPELQRGNHRLPSGGWWYGFTPENSLHLRGTRPGAMLQDPERRLPYDTDSQRFYSTFARLLSETLFGR